MRKILLYMFCVLAFISMIACKKTPTTPIIQAEIMIALEIAPLVLDSNLEGVGIRGLENLK